MTRWLVIGMGLMVLVAGAAIAPHLRPRVLPPRHLDQVARRHFLRDHPGEKPLNDEIGRAAVALHKAKPMG